MIQRDELLRFARRAKPAYVEALCSDDGAAVMNHFGVLGSVDRLSGWFGNVGHETGGLTIRRESLAYSNPDRLKVVWPTRFDFANKKVKKRYGILPDSDPAAVEDLRQQHEAWVASLCGNEIGLADQVYGGRMGNRSGTSDAYDFRGCDWLQNTGREGIVGIATACGMPEIEANPELLSNASVTLRLACYEWAHAGCNELMDQGNFAGACAAINVGNAKSIKAVVGMDDRIKWYNLARSIWAGDANALDLPEALLLDVDGDGLPDRQNWADFIDENGDGDDDRLAA